MLIAGDVEVVGSSFLSFSRPKEMESRELLHLISCQRAMKKGHQLDLKDCIEPVLNDHKFKISAVNVPFVDVRGEVDQQW